MRGNHNNIIKVCGEIIRNKRNWRDCLMVVLLDTPISIIGTLWGVILISGFYHFSDSVSSAIVMALFAGLMMGSPLWGILADRYHYPAWQVIAGAGASFIICMLLLIATPNSLLVSAK